MCFVIMTPSGVVPSCLTSFLLYPTAIKGLNMCPTSVCVCTLYQGRTDHLETRVLPEGPGSIGGP
ncbi:unnamed protein product [Staurois parvus]|uniref:Uncharacterized protein n=1 Tax=Staurois parvus TaxID=386267 RepID=A0ABN9GJR2_9NEOB|nr:unnamed protein product [Staurois parvus]